MKQMLHSANPEGVIAAVGEAVIELIPDRSDGLIREMGSVMKTVSGSSAIFAAAAARLGAKAALIGRVGRDALSELALAALAAEGVDLSQMRVEDEGQLGVAFVEYTKTGRNFQLYRKHSAGSLLSAEDIDEAFVRRAFALHYSGMLLELTPQMQGACLRAVAYARRHGVLVSFDPNVRKELMADPKAKERLLQSVGTADIVTPSREEAAFLTGETEIPRMVAALHQMGPRAVAITCDADGAAYSCGNGIFYAKGLPVAAVDPTGAGDTFAAALVIALKEGLDEQSTLSFCNRAGAFTTTRRGTIALALPTRGDLQNLLAWGGSDHEESQGTPS